MAVVTEKLVGQESLAVIQGQGAGYIQLGLQHAPGVRFPQAQPIVGQYGQQGLSVWTITQAQCDFTGCQEAVLKAPLSWLLAAGC